MTRRSTILIALAAIAIIGAGALWYVQVYAPSQQRFALLTDQQAADVKKTPPLLERGLDVTNTEGPLIRVSSPNGRALASPVDFDIQIEPNDGVPINMSSIRIEYKIGPAWINVTRTIMKYASVKGSRLSARGAELPSGNHLLRVSVADDQKRKTQATVNFSVNK